MKICAKLPIDNFPKRWYNNICQEGSDQPLRDYVSGFVIKLGRGKYSKHNFLKKFKKGIDKQ